LGATQDVPVKLGLILPVFHASIPQAFISRFALRLAGRVWSSARVDTRRDDSRDRPGLFGKGTAGRRACGQPWVAHPQLHRKLNQEIARRLEIAPKTIGNHIEHGVGNLPPIIAATPRGYPQAIRCLP
jgi:hypothetical protein